MGPLPQSRGWESLGSENSDGRRDDAGETGFPPSPLPQSAAYESLGSDNSDGRSKSGLTQ
jgi:hypothetical protein